MKRKGAQVDEDEMRDGLGSNDSYGQAELTHQERQPPYKCQRIAKSTRGVEVRKQLRGKQAGLASLVNVPIDIFTEVASYLRPGDIISLARSNKLLRNFLMRKTATSIWRGAMKNVKGLPRCPAHTSEPRYLSLIFTKMCSMCGIITKASVDPYLLVRFCKPCRDTNVIRLESVPTLLKPWVMFSGKRRSAGADVLRQDVSDLLAEYESRKLPSNSVALNLWTKERKEIIGTRQKHALLLAQFLAARERDRERESTSIKEVRRMEIRHRLINMGWAEEDIGRIRHEREWHDLVSQPKPLTDRIWSNLRPKLIVILEADHKERMRQRRERLEAKRRHRLSQLFRQIKNKDALMLDFKAHNPLGWAQLSTPIPTICCTYRGLFPSFGHTLEWPLVKTLCETDMNVETMEAMFQKHQGEIKALVADWICQVQGHFTNLLHNAYENMGKVPQPTIAVCNADSDPLINISDDLKILLRADSIFYLPTSPDHSKWPWPYNSIVSTEGLIDTYSSFESTSKGLALTLDAFEWYSEAHEVAQQLLASMGRPNASYPEMKSVGIVFVCGRCHKNDHRGWEGMHYVEQREHYAKIQVYESHLSEEGIIYNNVHDPELFCDQPMVTDCTTKSLQNSLDRAIDVNQPHRCMVCKKIPSADRVWAPKARIWKHLLDVHGITQPKVDEYYTHGSDPFELDGYDSEVDSIGKYVCNCSKPHAYATFSDPERTELCVREACTYDYINNGGE